MRRCPAASGRRYLCRLPSARRWGRRRGKPPAPRKRGGGGTGAVGLFVARPQGFDGAPVPGGKRPLAPLPILPSLRRWGKRRTLSATQGGAAALFSAVDAAETALLGSHAGCACHRDALSGRGAGVFSVAPTGGGRRWRSSAGAKGEVGERVARPRCFFMQSPQNFTALLCQSADIPRRPFSRAAAGRYNGKRQRLFCQTM